MFPLIALTVELMVLIVLLVGGLAGRHARGFRRSGRVRDEVAAQLALGHSDIRPTEAIT